MNPDPCTSLAEKKVNKLLHLQTLAENITDGFSTVPHIIRHALPETGNSFPSKRRKLHAFSPSTATLVTNILPGF